MKHSVQYMTATGILLMATGMLQAETLPGTESGLANEDSDSENIKPTINSAADKKQIPPRHGYGIGYEYRMKQREQMARPMHESHRPQFDRPQAHQRMERPERAERPATVPHPVRPPRPDRPDRPGRHN